jgi:amidase
MTLPHTDPQWWTATETLAALQARKLGAVELLDHMLARQSRFGPAINAVIEVNEPQARAEAQAHDAGTRRGALAGLPMTIKDTYAVAGFGCTAGIPDLASYRSPADAAAVAQLRGAGAVVWGKTNVPLAASDHQSYNPIHGVTRNPWNTDRTPGGSSGGAGAALAAGLTALELGSDIGGSIRVPAHYCGVWGHKPSYGIVPQRGHVPPMPGTLGASPLAVCGPMARSAADLQLAMDLLTAAPTPGWTLSLPPARCTALKGARLAVLTGTHPTDPAYAAAIHAFAADLRHAGAAVTLLDSAPSHLQGDDDLYYALLFATIGADLPPEALAAYAAAAAAFPEDSLPARVARATVTDHATYVRLAERQQRQIAGWEAWFAGFDALITPAAMNVAFPHQTEDGHGPIPQMFRTLSVGSGTRPYIENLFWPGIATLAHLPATVRPLPAKVHDMPAGIQIIGPAYGDRTTLALAGAMDAVFGGFTPPAGF